MHKTIKRFGLDGTIGDHASVSQRAHFESIVIEQMRDLGYVPVFGLGPFWSFDYHAEQEAFKFILSVHGVYVGRNKAWTTDGITVEGRTLMRQSKSSQSSQHLE